MKHDSNLNNQSVAIASSENISGTIERVTFHNEENGFCVLRVRVQGRSDLLTVVGSAITCRAGEFIECFGEWFNDKEYGLQFRANEIKLLPPNTKIGVEKYLASGLIKGIGPHFAKKLVKAFGTKVFDVLDNKPEKLLKLSGIGKSRIESIKKAWHEQSAVRDIMVFLQSHGIGTARSVRIYKAYGDDAISMVSENPYRLARDVYGIGFKVADSLAINLGVAKDSLLRAEAGLYYVLKEFSKFGHVAIKEPELITKTQELLEIDESILEHALRNQVKSQNLIIESDGENNLLFLPSLHQAELSVAQNIWRLLLGKVPWPKINVDDAIKWVFKKTHLELSPSQKEALSLALKSKVLIITGGPGVGKTTLVNSILKIVRAKGASVSLCAPTGRAAKRLSETSGLTAKTIHRLLEYNPHEHGFKRNRLNPLHTELLVLDEASMVDISLMHSLLNAIPDKAALLIVGDKDQLPSVGPGKVLADLIESEVVPVVKLTEIFRQAKRSHIIVNAHRINQGLFPFRHDEENDSEESDFYLLPAKNPEEMQDKLLKVVLERLPKRFNFDPLNDVQVLTPMHRGGVGTKSINAILQKKINGKNEPRINRFGSSFIVGDKVIQNVNNYDKEVFNGDIGRIHKIDLEDDFLSVDFAGHLVEYDFNELDELALAYATSIHKSQGSEYPVVVLLLANQHFMLLARKLLYTAVTRGKKMVVVIAEMKALAMAVRNIRESEEGRLTRLRERLKKIDND